jgi:hypothetical protein
MIFELPLHSNKTDKVTKFCGLNYQYNSNLINDKLTMYLWKDRKSTIEDKFFIKGQITFGSVSFTEKDYPSKELKWGYPDFKAKNIFYNSFKNQKSVIIDFEINSVNVVRGSILSEYLREKMTDAHTEIITHDDNTFMVNKNIYSSISQYFELLFTTNVKCKLTLNEMKILDKFLKTDTFESIEICSIANKIVLGYDHIYTCLR